MFEMFTDSARQAIILGEKGARELRSPHIGTEHLLLGVMRLGRGLGYDMLAEEEVSHLDISDLIKDDYGVGSGPSPTDIPFTPRAKRTLEAAVRESGTLGHDVVTADHILLALLADNEGGAAKILDFLVFPTSLYESLRANMAGDSASAVATQARGPVSTLRKAEEDFQAVHETRSTASPFSAGREKKSWLPWRRSQKRSTKRGLEGPQG